MHERLFSVQIKRYKVIKMGNLLKMFKKSAILWLKKVNNEEEENGDGVLTGILFWCIIILL